MILEIIGLFLFVVIGNEIDKVITRRQIDKDFGYDFKIERNK